MTYLLLLAPSANRVYAGETARLAASELALSAPFVRSVESVRLAGIDYISFDADRLGPDELLQIARQSAALALFHLVPFDTVPSETGGELLRPVELPSRYELDDDLVTIPKYQGKTNEQFTQLLLNLTLAAVRRPMTGPRDVLDPLCGRGTTLLCGWLLGCNGYGVEGDTKAVEAMAAYVTTWLRRKRLKHASGMSPVRRDGKSLGKRFDAELKQPPSVSLRVFTGDTRQSAALFGKKSFDAIVTDAPYGVVHGAQTDVRGHAGKRDRSPAGLLGEAIPVWAGQLRSGGALGLSWNTHGLTREDLAAMLAGAGLEVLDGPLWPGFGHRVDSSIHRDLIVAVRPG